LLGFAESCQCRRQVLLRYFGDDSEACGNCDVCLDPPETFDGSVAAQKLLSCIYRTGERFGQAHVISVLLGELDERIGHLCHDKLSTFGIGREHDRNAWRSIVRQLVAHGLIAVDVAGHGGLSISPDGRQFLREKPSLSLRVLRRARAERKSARRDARAAFPATNRALFEKLRAKRLELAKAQNVPPYVIFHDRTLVEMAARCPRSVAQFAAIPGAGEAKLARYGEAFLEVINGHDTRAGEDIRPDEALPLPAVPSFAYEEPLATIKQRHPRAYEKWTHEEDTDLLSLRAAGTPLFPAGHTFPAPTFRHSLASCEAVAGRGSGNFVATIGKLRRLRMRRIPHGQEIADNGALLLRQPREGLLTAKLLSTQSLPFHPRRHPPLHDRSPASIARPAPRHDRHRARAPA
jgi:hypothetical protein